MKKKMKAKEPRYEYWPEGRFEHPAQFIPVAERDRRWNIIRTEMRKRGIDCLVAYDGPIGQIMGAMARYITNCHGFNDGWVMLPIAILAQATTSPG